MKYYQVKLCDEIIDSLKVPGTLFAIDLDFFKAEFRTVSVVESGIITVKKVNSTGTCPLSVNSLKNLWRQIRVVNEV